MSSKIVIADLPVTALSEQVQRRRVTGERLELIHYYYQPGSVFSRHSHEAEQLTIVLTGTLVFEFDDEIVALNSGEAVLIASNRPHGAHVPKDSDRVETYNIFTPVRDSLPSA
ncbi:MAG: cupin domain-containing protein [Deinococcota bacterium]